MSPTRMRTNMPQAALVILLALAIGAFGALPSLAAAQGAGVPADAATAAVSPVVPATALAAPATAAPVATAAASVSRSRELVAISGTVFGRGGTGKWAWTMTLSGARVWVLGYSTTVTTDALGRYSLRVNLPGTSLYDVNEIRASRVNYEIGALPLSSEILQTRDFVGKYALLVKGTGLKVTVWRAGKKLKGATVSCFGKSAKTGANGKATLSKLRLKPGVRYTATVAKKGLRTATFSFTSRPGNSIGKSVALRK
jgi:hypothetical protein